MKMNRILAYFRIRPKTVVLLVLLLICFYLMTLHRKESGSTNSINLTSTDKNTIHLAIVVCGAVDRIFKLYPLIKSAIFLSESPIHFHFVVEDLPKQNIEKFYEGLPYLITERVTFIYYETWFPEEDHNWWLTAYKRCASQKIFLQTVLKDVEKVIYLDTDTLIVHQLEEIWKKFDDFEPQHVIGATPDCPFYGCAYYKKPIGQKTHVPVVWDAGLNAGVIFMRLDRMREFKFQEKLIEYAVEFKDRLLFHEQDLMNILFTNYIDNLLRVDCSYNYFPMVYCSQSTPCNKLTLKIAHGYLNQFEINQSLFQMISQFILNMNILDEKPQILKDLRKRIEVHVSSDNCQVIKKNIFID